ncbi:holdfast anchoring protein HfaB [Caulobacter sp. SLTY]|uniref:holdfast anchoring protein HfaB n=1 Tax=Caulobacter sp. SLTY TaxID=2683262 RepID=UPI0014123226|nr:holdfast anchoring protein HfaB [Caulobacter sp. SLTY]NBB14960.1 holdfast anchoring protein HfaB [Caulobacter sp. SLTY]
MKTKSALRAGTILAIAAVGLSACVSPVAGPSGVYAKPIGNAPVTANPSPYSAALVCIGGYARQHKLGAPRIAVGRISDYTGKAEADGSGRKVTQGASLMAMTALAKAGMPLVERFDTSISELDLKYSNNKLISDGPRGPGPGPTESRKIYEGQVAGVDFYLVGGITELNYNIYSVGADAYAGDKDTTGLKGNFRNSIYVMNVAIDLRLVNSRSLEVVDVISYQKQIIGREVGVGIFDFLNGNIFDVSAGAGAQEPLQLAVRSLIERAVVEISANLYGMPGPQSCLTSDPLGGATTGMTGGFTPAYDNLRTNNGETREDPNRWNDKRDRDAGRALRGRY